MDIIGFVIGNFIMGALLFALHRLKSRKARYHHNQFVLGYPIAIRGLLLVALLLFTFGPLYLQKLHPQTEMKEYAAFIPLILITLIGFLEAQNDKVYFSENGISTSSLFGTKKEANWEDLCLISYSDFWNQHVLHFKSGKTIRVSKHYNGVEQLLELIQHSQPLTPAEDFASNDGV